MTRYGQAIGTILAAMLLSGCADRAPLAARLAPGPHADLRDAGGTLIARATSNIAADGLRLRVEAVAMRPGTYGVHIHEVGRCDPPDFVSAGPHWNPSGRQHGSQNPLGMHMGDLPNLVVDDGGHGTIDLAIGGDPVGDGDGAALVVHANPDDYRTDPSGNSGARIACGVLG